MTLLVVDDDPVVRMTFRTLLKELGHLVITASDAEDATAKLEEHPVDLMISDVLMPQQDGLCLRNQLRETDAFARLPILFISGYDDDVTSSAVRNPAIEGFYKKGNPVSQLADWIAYLTNRKKKKPPVEFVMRRPPGNHRASGRA